MRKDIVTPQHDVKTPMGPVRHDLALVVNKFVNQKQIQAIKEDLEANDWVCTVRKAKEDVRKSSGSGRH